MAQKSARSAISVLFGFCLSVVFCFVFFSFKLSTDSHSAGCTQNGVRRDTGSSRFTAVAPPSTLCNILYIYICCYWAAICAGITLPSSEHVTFDFARFSMRFSRQLTYGSDWHGRVPAENVVKAQWVWVCTQRRIAPYKSYLWLLLIIINNRRLTQSVNRPNAAAARPPEARDNHIHAPESSLCRLSVGTDLSVSKSKHWLTGRRVPESEAA